MRTEHLDNKINELETLRSRGELTYMGSEMLIEFNAIKQALSIANVGWQSEQLQSFVSGFYEWHKKQGYVSVKREDWDDYIKTL